MPDRRAYHADCIYFATFRATKTGIFEQISIFRENTAREKRWKKEGGCKRSRGAPATDDRQALWSTSTLRLAACPHQAPPATAYNFSFRFKSVACPV